MIQLTIQDSQDSMRFGATLLTPITLTPIINETDIETLDGNISTYYSSTKRQYSFKLYPMDSANYVALKGFIERQYSNLRYPSITVDGAENLNVDNMTAKMTLNEQQVVNQCGLVDNITVTFRESRQMA